VIDRLRRQATIRVCVAPDSFKGCMTAGQAADAMIRGAQRAAEALAIPINIDRCPIADGGEGTLEALGQSASFHRKTTTVEGPFGDPIEGRWARVQPKKSRVVMATTAAVHAVLIVWLTLMYSAYLLLFGGRKSAAVIETASVIGLATVPPARRDPTRVSTFGVGKLIQSALKTRSRRVIVALGGSASCDGGVGMAAGLGAKFYDAQGVLIERPTGADLRRIASVDPSGISPNVNGAKLIAAFDVDNPLTGADGAARVYGPQKGATPLQIEDLDLGLESLVRVCREAGLTADPDAPGAGAAGGLGFALATFCNAQLRPGARVVLEAIDFERRVGKADLVLTGEGTLDKQSLRGKAPVTVAAFAATQGIPTFAFAGRVTTPFNLYSEMEDEPWTIDGLALFERTVQITPDGMDESTAIRQAPQLLETAVFETLRKWLAD
jgi:glycerate kinase